MSKTIIINGPNLELEYGIISKDNFLRTNF